MQVLYPFAYFIHTKYLLIHACVYKYTQANSCLYQYMPCLYFIHLLPLTTRHGCMKRAGPKGVCILHTWLPDKLFLVARQAVSALSVF